MYFLGYLLLMLNLCLAARRKFRARNVATKEVNLKEKFKAYERYATQTTIIANNLLSIYYREVPTQNDIMKATIAYFDMKTYFKKLRNTTVKLDRISDAMKLYYARKTSSEADTKAGTGEFQRNHFIPF